MADIKSPLTPRHLNSMTPSITMETPKYSTYEDIENLGDSSDPFINLDATTPIQSPVPKGSSQPRQSPTKQLLEQTATLLTEDNALLENESLSQEIQIPEDTSNGSLEIEGDEDAMSTIGAPQGYSGMDDTNFTAFSAVPNIDMTLFARIGQSPAKSPAQSPAKSSRQARDDEARKTPRQNGRSTPGSSTNESYIDCSPSPTPRRPKSSYESDTTNLILDFTEQFNAISRHSPYKGSRRSPKKSQTQPDLAAFLSGRRAPSPSKYSHRPSTPPNSRHLPSLLDFDLPPAPTPRSVPSITARELESLKSSFLSQVSSLRANLSGKEAEVNSLKEAVGDAEHRVGEALEEIRNLKDFKEGLQAEKAAWQSRDKDMQNVLRSVKEEIMRGDRERDQVQQRLEEWESKCADAEARTIEAESKLAGLETASHLVMANGEGHADSDKLNASVAVAVEKLARELHALYKNKHEIKVGTLKESYRARWGRRTRELETKIAQLSRENEDLREGKDATFSGVLPADLVKSNTQQEQEELLREVKRREGLEAKVHDLQQEIARTKHSNEVLFSQLEQERVGMAELVAATEEMMELSLQASLSETAAGVQETASSMKLENLRGSISRASSGLRVPSGSMSGGAGLTAYVGESRIGKVGAGRGYGPLGGRIGLKEKH